MLIVGLVAPQLRLFFHFWTDSGQSVTHRPCTLNAVIDKCCSGKRPKYSPETGARISSPHHFHPRVLLLSPSLTIYYMLSMGLSAIPALSSLIPVTILHSKCYHDCQFTNEERGVQVQHVFVRVMQWLSDRAGKNPGLVRSPHYWSLCCAALYFARWNCLNQRAKCVP